MTIPREPRQPYDPDGLGSPQPGGPENQMTYQPGWDLSVLENPVVLDVPDALSTDPSAQQDPLLRACIDALALTFDRNPEAPTRIGDLARAGVVALRTSAGSLEVRETVLGWVLAHAWGDPDGDDLATAARLRAHRLAGERHVVCGGPPTEDTPIAGRSLSGRSGRDTRELDDDADEIARADHPPVGGADRGQGEPADDRDCQS